jgi:hypothetical protein
MIVYGPGPSRPCDTNESAGGKPGRLRHERRLPGQPGGPAANSGRASEGAAGKKLRPERPEAADCITVAIKTACHSLQGGRL